MIKFINSASFVKLTVLKKVWLRKNTCIKEDFLDETRIAILTQKVTEKCGYDDNLITSNSVIEDKEKENAKLIETLKLRNQVLETFVNETILKKQICESTLSAKAIEVTRKTSTIARLEAELLTTKSQLALMESLSKKLEAQHNNTLAGNNGE